MLQRKIKLNEVSILPNVLYIDISCCSLVTCTLFVKLSIYICSQSIQLNCGLERIWITNHHFHSLTATRYEILLRKNFIKKNI